MTALRVWTPQVATVRFVRQVAPAVEVLTTRRAQVAPQAGEYRPARGTPRATSITRASVSRNTGMWKAGNLGCCVLGVRAVEELVRDDPHA